MQIVSENRDADPTTQDVNGTSPGRPTAIVQDALADETISPVAKRHILTVNVEDYFQVGAFQRLIHRKQWSRFETRLVTNTERSLELLQRFDVKGTFFVLGWIAERFPELIAQIAEHGHEVASRGFYHRSVRDLSREEFREDLARTREVLEGITGRRVRGYRLADGWLNPDDFWILDVLAAEGYAFDSSLCPILRTFRAEPERHFVHEHRSGFGSIWEVPPSSVSVLGCSVPVAGGNYFRQFPHSILKHVVDRWHRRQDVPFVMYFHVWELDPDQPRITAVGPLTRIRHYRNLTKMEWVLEDYLSRYGFGPIAESLNLGQPETVQNARRSETLGPEYSVRGSGRCEEVSTSRNDLEKPDAARSDNACPKTTVTVVIPCFNEERTICYLANTLEEVEFTLSAQYEPRFVFVDDCSTDATFETLQNVFGGKSNCEVIRHEQNQGVAAAILTGIHQAQSDIVCSMDCDCSYDPHELKHMIPLLGDGVDLVTASPYHPRGHVRNVPTWRLFLSKTLSGIYRRVLREKLFTYTSCFRVYRRSAVSALRLEERGFLGVAELLGKLSLAGARIVEYPTTLDVRIFGESKMKTCRTIVGHLRLLCRLAAERIRRCSPSRSCASHPNSVKTTEMRRQT